MTTVTNIETYKPHPRPSRSTHRTLPDVISIDWFKTMFSTTTISPRANEVIDTHKKLSGEVLIVFYVKAKTPNVVEWAILLNLTREILNDDTLILSINSINGDPHFINTLKHITHTNGVDIGDRTLYELRDASDEEKYIDVVAQIDQIVLEIMSVVMIYKTVVRYDLYVEPASLPDYKLKGLYASAGIAIVGIIALVSSYENMPLGLLTGCLVILMATILAMPPSIEIKKEPSLQLVARSLFLP